MYKIKIVTPDLVSIKINIEKIREFYLLRNINYFGNSEYNLKFNYKISLRKDINIPQDYNFRSNNYQVKNNIWTYSFSKFGFKFAFQYNYYEKEFIFNNTLNKLPIRVNWIHPAGDYIADIINLELFINSIIILNGVAFKHKNKIYVFCAPSLNGKTTFLKNNREKFEELISDDYVVVDLKNKKIARTPLLEKSKNEATKNWYQINKIHLIINSTDDNCKENFTPSEFVKMSAMKFQDNIFIKNLIFYYHLEKEINKVLDNLNLSNLFIINNIKNYDYQQFLRD